MSFEEGHQRHPHLALALGLGGCGLWLWRAAPATSDSPEACPTRYEVRDCLTDTRATGVTVAAIDVVLLDALRARVASHLDDLAARLLAAPGAALDVAPEIWAGLRGALRLRGAGERAGRAVVLCSGEPGGRAALDSARAARERVARAVRRRQALRVLGLGRDAVRDAGV